MFSGMNLHGKTIDIKLECNKDTLHKIVVHLKFKVTWHQIKVQLGYLAKNLSANKIEVRFLIELPF